MIHFIFTDRDPRYMFLKGDTSEDISNLKCFKSMCCPVDPACYLPSYKNSGRPQYTQDFIWEYDQVSGDKVYYGAIGMWQVAYKFFKTNNYEFDGLLENKDFFKNKIQHSFEEFVEIIRGWNLKYFPRPYQLEAAYKILQYKQSLSVLSTRAGKTLIAYCVFRYCMEYLNMKRILMIVPSITLVKQGYSDFDEYAEFFKTECIWSGGKIVESSNLTIGTFQSLIGFLDRKSKRYNQSFFDTYDFVFVDEVHRATANQIKTIISQPFMKNVKIAYGMTGTLPKEKTIDSFCLHSLLGAKIQDIEPKELMDAGYISKIDITQIRLSYKNVEKQYDAFIKCAEYVLGEFVMEQDPKNPKRKKKIMLQNPEHQILALKKLPDGLLDTKLQLELQYGKDTPEFKNHYIDILYEMVKASDTANFLVIERMMSHFMEERIDFLCYNILPLCINNTLILAHHTQYIDKLYIIIKERFPDKNIVKITGSVNLKERQKIIQMFKENNNCIMIASYGTMSTGITLHNLCHGILFESFKSNVVNMQSLGRGLGLSDLKEKYEVYDIIDMFDEALKTKSIFLQGAEKIKIYKKNEYPYKIVNKTI